MLAITRLTTHALLAAWRRRDKITVVKKSDIRPTCHCHVISDCYCYFITTTSRICHSSCQHNRRQSLLSRRSPQRERLNALRLSICSSVCRHLENYEIAMSINKKLSCRRETARCFVFVICQPKMIRLLWLVNTNAELELGDSHVTKYKNI